MYQQSSMKQLYLLLFLCVSTAALAQEKIDTEAFIKEQEQIRTAEQARARRLSPDNTNGINGTFSVATDNFDIHHSTMEWYVNPAIRYISGKITFDYTIVSATNTITFDLIKSLIVDSVLYHGSKISFVQTDANGVDISFPTTLAKGLKDSVSIFYQGVPDNTGMGSYYNGVHNGTIPVSWTLSEPYGSRDWWPCKNNLLDKTDSIDIYLSCPQEFQGSSNGMIISNTVNGSTRTTHFKHRHPIATYLVAIAISDYEITNDSVIVNNKSYLIQNFTYKGIAANFLSFASYYRNGYRIFTNLFGPYPFADEKYGHTQWGWNGGMEHQTNSFINLPTPNLAAHELAHHWFGDYITCGSWQDTWLNEGFATYATLLFLEYGYPNSYGSTLNSTFRSATTDSSGAVFCSDTSNVARIFSGRITYNKGAYVLHMLRYVMGDSAFYKGIRYYLADPAVKNGFAKTPDLKRNLELAYGKDLGWFFNQWVYGEGYANYKGEWYQKPNNWIKLKLSQSTTHQSVQFYKMPVTVTLKNSTQAKSYVLDHVSSGQEFWLNPEFAVDTIIIDPQQKILAKIKQTIKISAPDLPANGLKIFPNPTSGPLQVAITNPDDAKLSVKVFSSTGQLVYTTSWETPGYDQVFTIPMQQFAHGTYFVEVKNSKSLKVTKKIVH